MSWIDRAVERKVAEAIARGELDAPEMHGKPLDLDSPRSDGWWAEQFVRRERSRLLRDESLPHRAAFPVRFWRAATVGELVATVTEANRWVTEVNTRLLTEDRLELFDHDEIIETWRALPR